MTIVDARGLSCPEPVVRVNKGIAAHPEGVVALVDSMVCVENIKRFAASRGYELEISNDNGEYALTLTKA